MSGSMQESGATPAGRGRRSGRRRAGAPASGARGPVAAVGSSAEPGALVAEARPSVRLRPREVPALSDERLEHIRIFAELATRNMTPETVGASFPAPSLPRTAALRLVPAPAVAGKRRRA